MLRGLGVLYFVVSLVNPAFSATPADYTRPSFAGQDYLRLFFYRPPVYIDWSSPEKAVWTALKASLATENDYLTGPRVNVGSPRSNPTAGMLVYNSMPALHSIGHTNVNIHCQGEEEHWSGMTDHDDNTDKDWVLGGSGMEVIFLDKIGHGVWFTKEQIFQEMPQFNETGRVSSVTLKINHQTCKRLLTYAHEYQQKGYDKIFGGLLARPRFGEGAGCTAYGLSYLELAGLMTGDMQKALSRSINIPLSVLGHYPKVKPTGYDMQGLAFHGLLGDGNTRWAREDEAQFPITFYDPELAYDWVKAIYKTVTDKNGRLMANVYGVIDAYKVKNSSHIVVDETQIATPQGPVWLDPKDSPRQTW